MPERIACPPIDGPTASSRAESRGIRGISRDQAFGQIEIEIGEAKAHGCPGLVS